MRLIDADVFLSKVAPDEYYHTNEIRAMVADTLAASNDPLTLEELREMGGEPVWCKDCSRYGTISVDTKGVWEGIPFFSFRYEDVNFCWNVDDRNLTLYRRKPEEGMT